MSTTNNNKIERRSFVEVCASQGDAFELVGYCALYNVESKDLGGFVEILAPGCFDRSLSNGDPVYFCFNHSVSAILARSDNGTLELSSDDKGLRFKAKLNRNISLHKDIYESCRSGLYRECSFGFTVGPDGQKWANGVRTITDCRLIDTSLVGMPAYEGTSASARSRIPSTEDLRARLARINKQIDKQDHESEDEARRKRADELGVKIYGTNQRSYDGDDKDTAMDELQELCDARYGQNRYKVIDCDGTRSKGYAIVRDMCSDSEDFYAVDYDEDDEQDERQLQPGHVSSLCKKLRFTSNRRRVMPQGTTWSKSKRALDVASEWLNRADERAMQQRIAAASR